MENNNLPIDELLQKIAAEEGDSFIYDRQAIIKDLEEQRSAYTNPGINLLSIFGGLLASACFIAFLFLVMDYPSQGVMVIIGLLFIGGAVVANKVTKLLLLDTATITFYLAGYGILIIGLMDLRMSDDIAATCCLILSVAAILISSSAMLVFASVLIASGSLLSFLLIHNNFDSLHIYVALLTTGFTYVSLYQAKLLAAGKEINQRYNPLRGGLLLSLVIALVLLAHHKIFGVDFHAGYISSIIIIVAIFFSIRHISRTLLVTKVGKLMLLYSISLLVLLPTWFAPAISGAFLIILLSFYSGHKSGFIAGIGSLMYFVSQYYYDLQFTLLTKSIVLMVSGVAFLLLFFLLKKQLQTP